jgi:Tfp pilus assembly protein PilF
MPLIIRFLSLLAMSFATVAIAAEPPPFRAPYLPEHDADVLQEVPSRSDPKVADMASLRGALDAAPQSEAAALQLADAYVEYGRQVGDAHYAGYAEAVIAPWMSQAAPPAAIMTIEAIILQYRHQFAEARALLQRALKTDARQGQAWLTLANLDMVQGAYAIAARDCAEVTSHAGLQLGLACAAAVRMNLGQAAQSLQMLERALGSETGVSAGTRGWMLGLMAEAAERLGDWPLAESHYRAALQLLPQDNFLLVAYADYLLDRGRPEEVLPLLAGHTQSDTAFLRIALARTALRSPDAARDVWIMAARFEALTFRGSDYFGREQARFALDLQHDPRRSLEIARQNWQVQRAPWDARVLLEAAVAAEDEHAASETLAFLEQTQLQDPVIKALVERLRAKRLADAHP